jgi:WD repeat-containing protein 26
MGADMRGVRTFSYPSHFRCTSLCTSNIESGSHSVKRRRLSMTRIAKFSHRRRESTVRLAAASRSQSEDTFVASDELVQLLVQGLRHIGLDESAEFAEKESGIQVLSEGAAALQGHILRGQWAAAIEVIASFPVGGDLTEAVREEIIYQIYRQEYLGLVAAGDIGPAIEILRSKLASFPDKTNNVALLSSLLLCEGEDEIRKDYDCWLGSSARGREALLDAIEILLPPSVLPARARFQQLLSQAIQWQRAQCPYHNVNVPSSSSSPLKGLLPGEEVSSSSPLAIAPTVPLFQDHTCDFGVVPSLCARVISAHQNEIWHLAMAPNGGFFVSGSKDKSMRIWSCETLQMVADCSGLGAPVSSLAISPDSRFILSGSTSPSVTVWAAEDGNAICNVVTGGDVSAVCWCGGSEKFAVACAEEKSLKIFSFNPESYPCTNLEYGDSTMRFSDLIASPDGTRLYCANGESLFCMQVENLALINEVSETENLTSLRLSSDGLRLLASVQSRDIHLYDTRSLTLLRRFQGHVQLRFIIRSCFGGAHEQFVVSGSEDSTIRIWNSHTGEVLAALHGHEASVNAVAWSRESGVLLSASDDGTIRVWSP